MLIIENNNIFLNRGDDALLNVSITNSAGEAYEMQTGDSLTLTVRAVPTAESAVLLTATSTTSTITLTHAMTALLEVGQYSADIELTLSNGTKITVWPLLTGNARFKEKNYKNFTVMSEVTRA